MCGPSGSGKSTMIRCINILCINRPEAHRKGRIVIDRIELNDHTENFTAIRREVGMVFQQFNLFLHLTALENLALAPMRPPMRARNCPREPMADLWSDLVHAECCSRIWG